MSYYGAPAQANVTVQAESAEAIKSIPVGTLVRYEVNASYHGGPMVFLGELIASHDQLKAIQHYCATNGIMVTHIDVTHSPPMQSWHGSQPWPVDPTVEPKVEYIEKHYDNQKITNLDKIEKNIMNEYMLGLYEKNYVSGKSVVESVGLDYDKEMASIKAEQLAANGFVAVPAVPAAQAKLPKCLSVGELEAIEAQQKTVPPGKPMSEKIEEGRSFEMDFEEL